MLEFGELKYLNLRKVWQNEATDFTPWLADNIESLGKALGLELEIQEQESSVGDFSLDILARDLGSNRTVIIENQIQSPRHGVKISATRMGQAHAHGLVLSTEDCSSPVCGVALRAKRAPVIITHFYAGARRRPRTGGLFRTPCQGL